MKTDMVEKLLKKAPPVRTPPGLLRALQSDINPSRGETRITNRESLGSTDWFRRWLPALGFALWFLGCVVVLGLQANHLAGLREQQRTLESAKAAAAQQAIAAEADAAAAAAELEQLKKDWADLQRLRAETERLRAEVSELNRLRTEKEQLRAGVK